MDKYQSARPQNYKKMIHLETSSTILLICKTSELNHLYVSFVIQQDFALFFKASPVAHPFIGKLVFICMSMWCLNLQKRALRLLTLLHADLMRSRYSTNKIILPLKFQYCESFCTTMHDVSNNSLPANISKSLIYPTRMHTCNTRFYKTDSFSIKYSRTYKSVEIFIFQIQCKNLEPDASKYPSIPQT